MTYLHHIRQIDISDCVLVEASGLMKLVEVGGETLRELHAQNCQDAVVDDVLKALAGLETGILEVLDISYCKHVTDEGLQAFENKVLPLTRLCVSGLIGVTGRGLAYPIRACTETLLIFQGAMMDQEGLKIPDFGAALGCCFSIESIDLGGCVAITDQFFDLLSQQQKEVEGVMTKVGLVSLHTIKLNFLENVQDLSVQKVCQCAPALEHLELTGCAKLTDYYLGQIITNHKQLQFIDINHIPAVTPAILENLKNIRPDLLQRRYLHSDIDPKDNMLRVPLRIAEKGKAGGKGKKKKKKK